MNSRVTITVSDILTSVEKSSKALKWAHHKEVSKQNINYFVALTGPSEDLFFDLAILAGAKANQIKTISGSGPKSVEVQI